MRRFHEILASVFAIAFVVTSYMADWRAVAAFGGLMIYYALCSIADLIDEYNKEKGK